MYVGEGVVVGVVVGPLDVVGEWGGVGGECHEALYNQGGERGGGDGVLKG